VADTEMASARLPADLVAALKQRAAENGESLSDALRRGALMVLGICPTCGQKAPAPVVEPATEGAA
jgi:hypothetical protein